ncbi:transglycosylase SLT domain-containing protein [Paraburkholderia azotifigens]|uniref:lytic transglycosylase domain-containing protein n=1 Tax=Paraburkholderia azotifigens TaxID=2057004 RepID=UPI00318063EC
MSDSLDKFVLSYEVRLADSLSRLERLNDQMKKVDQHSAKASKSITSELKGALDSLTNSLGGVDGALGRVMARMAGLGGAAGVMVAGVTAAVALAAKGIRDMNAMSDLSFKTGIGTLQMENIQRNVSRFSNGRVSRDTTQQGMTQWRDFWKDAYVNPQGKSALAMSRMGINPRATGPNASMSAVAAWMHANPNDALAIGNQIGWNPNLTNAMAAGGSNITSMSMSPDAVKDHEQAQRAANDVNKFIGDLNESLKEWSFESADKVINFFRSVGHFMGGVGEALGKSAIAESEMATGQVINPNAKTNLTPAQQRQLEDNQKAAKQQAEAAQKASDTEDAAARANAEQDARWQQILASFSTSVDKFTGGAISQQEALAAWAGFLGQSNGLPGSTKPMSYGASQASFNSGTQNAAMFGTGGGTSWQSSPYAKEFGAAAKKFNVDPQMLAAIMHVESKGDPNAVSPTGAGGLMQITRGNQKAYGLKDYRDPASNIMVGAQILSEFLKRNHGNVDAALAGYNGHSDPNYVAKVRAVYGSGAAGGGGTYSPVYNDAMNPNARGSWTFTGPVLGRKNGESRDSLAYSHIQQEVAGALKIPLAQLNGFISKGDVNWVGSNLMSKAINARQALKMQLNNPALPDTQRSQIFGQLRTADLEISNLQKYMPTIESMARQGPREVSLGQARDIIINVNGATDPKAVAAEVNNQLTKAVNDLLSNHTTGIKG